jgi:hypothetical protein
VANGGWWWIERKRDWSVRVEGRYVVSRKEGRKEGRKQGFLWSL